MGNTDFVRSVVKEIIEPGVERLMDGAFFSELRDGRLSRRRLQGWALQQHYRNVELCKGFALLMVKYAHDPELFGYFSYQYNEEQDHPNLTKKLGYAIGLKDEDFQEVMPLLNACCTPASPFAACLPVPYRKIAPQRWSMKPRFAATRKNFITLCASITG